jgi:hypothetical protein
VLICIDFDGTIVRDDRPYDDVSTPLEFLDGARDGVLSLRAAGHTLVLWSGRTNRSLLYSQEWDPLVGRTDPLTGVTYKPRMPLAMELAGLEVHWARYRQMLAFIEANLPNVFAYVDDGLQGKPLADLFIDDKALRYSERANGYGWGIIRDLYGRPGDQSHLVPTGPRT